MLEQVNAVAETAVIGNNAGPEPEREPLVRLRSVTLISETLAQQAPQNTVLSAVGSDTQSERNRITFQVPIPRRNSSLVERFIPLQYWIGTVHSRDGDEVTAVLRDWGSPAMPEEEVAFSIEEFSPDDRPLLVEGTVFYWTIGYRTQAGTRERVSFFQVRRRPPPSRSQRRRAEKEAQALAAMLFGPDPRDGGHGGR